MKIHSARSITFNLAALVFACHSFAQAPITSPAWASDWSAFVAELGTQIAKDSYYAGNVNATFHGKTVTWTGKVSEIKRPVAEESGSISIEMKPETLTLKTGVATFSEVTLEPLESEWKSWESVSVGDTVTFATALDKASGFAPECVVTIFQGMGANAGKVFTALNHKGGTRVLPAQP